MRFSIATLIVSAMLVCTANAAPPKMPPPPKHRVVTCDQARPGTRLFRECHRRAPPKVVKRLRAERPVPGRELAPRP